MIVRIMYRGCQYDHLAAVEISDKCPICGQKRGSLYSSKAYDGSIPCYVDQWDNPCGHNESYNSVFHEAITNGYNLDKYWDFNNLNGFKITSENEKAILTDIRYKYHKNPKDDEDKFRLLVEIVEFIRYKNPQSKIKITYAGDLVDKEGECENFIKQINMRKSKYKCKTCLMCYYRHNTIRRFFDGTSRLITICLQTSLEITSSRHYSCSKFVHKDPQKREPIK